MHVAVSRAARRILIFCLCPGLIPATLPGGRIPGNVVSPWLPFYQNEQGYNLHPATRFFFADQHRMAGIRVFVESIHVGHKLGS